MAEYRDRRTTLKTGRSWAATLLAAVLIAATVSGSASATSIIPPTSITISSEGLYFYGKVKAPARGCQINRRVQLFLQLPGRDQMRGKVTTQRFDGRWSIRAQGTAGATLGDWYVKVRPNAETPKGGLRACQAARSKTVRVTVP